VLKEFRPSLTSRALFGVECIDRKYCSFYLPGLQFATRPVGYVDQ
jgi:hypothetical protein